MKWAPADRGRHLLAAVARDGEGRQVTSDSLYLSVIDPVPVQYNVAAGDSIESLGRKYAMEPRELIAANPQLGSPGDSGAPAGGLLPGTTLIIPRPHKLLPVSLQAGLHLGTEPPQDQPNTSTQGQTQTSTQGQTQTSPDNQPPEPSGEKPNGTDGPPPLSPGDLRVENGVLIMPDSYDLAYVYVTINKTHSERLPQGSGKFLPGSGYRFDLNKYLDGLIDEFQQPSLDIEMEVWGWQGWSLVEIGNLAFKYDRTVLTVCTKEGEAACGEAPWGGEVTLSNYKPLMEQKVDFKWAGADPAQVDRYFIWVACGTSSFGGGDQEPFTEQDIKGQISGWWVDSDETSLTYDIAGLYYDGPVSADNWEGYGTAKHYASNWFQSDFPLDQKEPFTISVRVTAYMKDGKTTKNSNVIKIRYKTEQKPEEYTLASDLPPIYDVEIVGYQPPVLPSEEKWGCIIVGGVEQCPQPWEPPGNWDVGSLVDGIGGMWDWLSQAYEDAKGWLVKNVLAPLIPGGCGDECKANLQKAMGYAVAAVTGLPPTLPSYDEISSQGLEAGFTYAAAQYGYECDDNCKKIVKAAFKQAMIDAWNKTPAPACDETAAHDRKKTQVCVEPGVSWEPAPHSIYQPGIVKVKITRNNDPGPVTKEDAGKYKLHLDFPGENSARIGEWIGFMEYQEGLTGPKNGSPAKAGGLMYEKNSANQITGAYGYLVKDPLKGNLFPTQDIEIPWLEPDQSITVPLALQRERYWYPNHDYNINNNAYMPGDDADKHLAKWGDDWLYLYIRGRLQINAGLTCENPGGQQVSCAGVGDSRSVQNPATVLDS